MSEMVRWQGTARLVLQGTLSYRVIASLWFTDEGWGGVLHIDRAPPAKELEQLRLQLELSDLGRFDITTVSVVQEVGSSAYAPTVLRFNGVTNGEVPSPKSTC